jgi:hypothetical protein
MYVFFPYIFSVRIFVKIVSCFFIILLLVLLHISTYAQRSNDASTDKVIAIISDDLKDQGIKRIKEIQKLSKSKDTQKLTSTFSKYNLEQTEIAKGDTIHYAVEEDTLDFDIKEIQAFFGYLVKNLPKKSKIIIADRSQIHEPIEMEFSLRIPSKRQPFDQSCSHHTITFRRDAKGKLLIREWYSMPGYMDCL